MDTRRRWQLVVVGAALAALGVSAAARPPAAQRGQESMFAESDAYERFMGRWSRQLAPLLIELAGVQDGERVLDLGSGTGALAFAVAERVPSAQVLGIDPSKAYVDFARAHAGGTRVRFEVGDAQALTLETGAFDRTLSLLVMNFVPAPARAAAEMARVTRPGGVVAAAVWDYGDGMEMLRIFWDEAVAAKAAAGARDERHMPLCRAGELAALWRAAGLRDVEERPLTVEQRFDGFDDFWTPFLGGQGPAGAYVATLSTGERDTLRERLRRRVVPSGDGAIVLRARAWAVRGTVAPPGR